MSQPWNETEARDLVKGGMSYTALARLYGSTVTTVHCWLDPAYTMHTRQRVNRNRMNKRNAPAGAVVNYRPPRETDVAARLAEIPPDTRNLTQRICGDPLPGRDALSRRAGN